MADLTEERFVDLDDGTPHWLVVQTKPRQERSAARHLWQRGVESYLPLLYEPRRHLRAPRGPVPLFASYLFVHCTPSTQLRAVRFCPGVLRPVIFSQRLAAVSQELITALRFREDEHGLIMPDEQRIALAREQRVRIIAGPLRGLEGVFKGYLHGRQRAQLLMEMLRAQSTVEVDVEALAVVRA